MAKFQPGQSGNPAGKKKGTTDWRSKLRAQIEKAAPEMIEKLITAAKGGDVRAIKLLLDKILPDAKPQSLPVNLAVSATDEAGQAEAIFAAMASGKIAPDAASDFMQVLGTLIKARELGEIERRIAELEKGVNRS